MKRRLLALLCMAALCLTLLPALAGASGTVYFTAVNDRILPLSADSMPMYSGGALYVPYNAFDSTYSGINLGVSCSYSRSGNTLTLYNLRQMLVYDMDEDNSRNQHTGQTYSARAVTRNGRVYVPLDFTCDFFGLNWSNSATEYGNLIRITNSAAVLSDADFIDAGSSWMASRLKEYQQSLNTGTPDPSPSSPSSSVSPSPSADPGSGTRVYFAFRCDTAEKTETILDTLDSYGYHAVFFLPPDLLAENGGLLRRIVGSGHSLGLLADGGAETESEALDALAEGNRLLERILHTGTCMVLTRDDLTGTLSQQGWLCWDTDVNGIPAAATKSATLSANVLRAVARNSGTVHITMDDSQVSSQALSSILRQLREDSYSIRLAVETDF